MSFEPVIFFFVLWIVACVFAEFWRKKTYRVIDFSDGDIAKPSEIGDIISRIIQGGGLSNLTRVKYRNILPHESITEVLVDENNKACVSFIFPEAGIDTRIVLHEIGHGYDFERHIRAKKRPLRVLGLRRRALRNFLRKMIGHEYLRERRAWRYSGVSLKDPIAATALRGYLFGWIESVVSVVFAVLFIVAAIHTIGF